MWSDTDQEQTGKPGAPSSVMPTDAKGRRRRRPATPPTPPPATRVESTPPDERETELGFPATERLTGAARVRWAMLVAEEKRCPCFSERTLERRVPRGGKPIAESFVCRLCATRYEALPPFYTLAEGPPDYLAASAIAAELFDASML